MLKFSRRMDPVWKMKKKKKEKKAKKKEREAEMNNM